MKTLSCDQCDTTFDADTFDDWFKQMQGHYMVAHVDVMMANAGISKEELTTWMDDAKKRFEDA